MLQAVIAVVAGQAALAEQPRCFGQDPLAGFVTDTVEEELAYGMEQLARDALAAGGRLHHDAEQVGGLAGQAAGRDADHAGVVERGAVRVELLQPLDALLLGLLLLDLDDLRSLLVYVGENAERIGRDGNDLQVRVAVAGAVWQFHAALDHWVDSDFAESITVVLRRTIDLVAAGARAVLSRT